MTHHENLALGDIITGRAASNFALHTGPVVEIRDRMGLWGSVTDRTIVIQSDTLNAPVVLG